MINELLDFERDRNASGAASATGNNACQSLMPESECNACANLRRKRGMDLHWILLESLFEKGIGCGDCARHEQSCHKKRSLEPVYRADLRNASAVILSTASSHLLY